ncbi:Heavy metal-associated domain, HMA [Cynara cardunculus var. scolymus]|uniref:Heavy metal-associated domain, HMA n=1 Tax=Cynara cardunculus var. scolymus TaxID=59895 RepID=A0A103XWI9_CYNCS|nr:Heavy metal-associated domain, HMA [Cynara cardunculus var. scolymus]
MVEEVQKAAEVPKSAADDKKQESEESSLPPPIVLRVFMHCEGCASKLRRCLKGFDGVDDVKTDCKTHTVVVKGEKADPLKVLERIQKKSHRQVELLSPVPKSPAEQSEKKEEKEASKPEEKKEEAPPQVITVVLKVHMHCEACAQGIRKRILKMNEADLKQSEVTVKGTFEPPQLAEYVNKKMGKQAMIVKQEPEPKKPEANNKGKDGKVEKNEGGADEKKATGEGAAKPAEAAGGADDKKVVELRKNEFNFYQSNLPRYAVESAYGYPAAPQIFSDENPNACFVM